jgi:outer membrane protein assembly factor BamB
MMKLTSVLVGFAIAAVAAPSAEDWPQFRGPNGQGHSAEQGLPFEWSESRGVAWKVPVPGRGWSSPVVAGGRIWLTSAIAEGRDVSLRAIAYEAATGKETVNVEVFRLRRAELLNQKNSHASPTPVVEGDRVFVHFGADGTAALTTAGAIVWKRREPYVSQHGNGGSPVLYGDLLIVNCDGADAAFVVAMDKASGRVRWKTWRREPWSQAYSTPLVVRVGDRDQLVSVGAHHAAAYDPATGRELWHVSYGDGFSNVPRPVAGLGLVYITTGFQQPSLLAVRPDGKGSVTRTHVAWTLARGVPHTPSPLLVGEHLYLVNDGGIASCVDARTGGIVWQQRLEGGYSASPIYADGRIYFQSESGVTTVIRPGPRYEPLASNVLEGATLASIAAADGSLFIRSATHLYRLTRSEAPRPDSRRPARNR